MSNEISGKPSKRPFHEAYEGPYSPVLVAGVWWVCLGPVHVLPCGQISELAKRVAKLLNQCYEKGRRDGIKECRGLIRMQKKRRSDAKRKKIENFFEDFPR